MNDLERLAKDLLQHLRRRHMRLATAESCTGGLIAATLTEVAGSSDVVERGFVTYSNEAKADLLGVAQADLAQHGAVSEPVAARYGWADNPVCNMYSGAGLPLTPFRTDDFPGVTVGKE